jgi:hypothetical protein
MQVPHDRTYGQRAAVVQMLFPRRTHRRRHDGRGADTCQDTRFARDDGGAQRPTADVPAPHDQGARQVTALAQILAERCMDDPLRLAFARLGPRGRGHATSSRIRAASAAASA